MSKSLLVTGATGLIGSEILPYLRERSLSGFDSIIEWDRQEHGDLLSLDAQQKVLHLLRPQIVMHLAWLSTSAPDYKGDPLNTEWANGTMSLARLSMEMGSWFIGFGSFIETQTNVNSAYSFSKRLAREGIARMPQFESQATWIRPSWVFDPVQLRPGVLGLLASSLENDTEFIPCAPNTRHDFIHVRDVATAVGVILTNQIKGVCDIGSGRTRSVNELLQAFRSMDTGVDKKSRQPFHEDSPADVAEVGVLKSHSWEPIYTDAYFAGQSVKFSSIPPTMMKE